MQTDHNFVISTCFIVLNDTLLSLRLQDFYLGLLSLWNSPDSSIDFTNKFDWEIISNFINKMTDIGKRTWASDQPRFI